jgi:hypothetical protein
LPQEIASLIVRVISELKMFRRWRKSFILVLVAALLLASQCYAMCAVSGCTASSSRGSHCHHHPENGNGSGQTCQHPHLESFSLEGSTDLVKLSAFHVAGVVALPFTRLMQALNDKPEAEILRRSEHHLPRATSVLALLSTFRI